MTSIEPWSIHDVAEFFATGRHSFHLTSDTEKVLSPDGVKDVHHIKATCGCGCTITGLTTLDEVFAVIRTHCEPL